jgi:hypothetical protein
VQVYEVNFDHLVVPDERVFMLGSIERSTPSTHGGLAGFFRYIPDVSVEREKRIHAAFDSRAQAPYGACAKKQSNGEYVVYVCADVSVTYGPTSVTLTYTSESADYYRAEQTECLQEARTGGDRKICKSLYDPGKVTPTQKWCTDLQYDEYFINTSWLDRALPPTNAKVLDIHAAIP